MSVGPRLKEAMKLQVAGQFNEAEAIYQEILADLPDQQDAVHLLGLVRMEQDRDDEAVQLMERALALYPAASHFHHNIAGLYRRMGRLEEAEAQFREAIELKPDYGEAYQGLAEMVKFKADDPLIEKINAQLRRKDLPANVRSYFHFAAGKICDDIGEYPVAFKHFTEGNRLADRQFDPARFRQMVKDTLYCFSPTQLKRQSEFGVESEKPTFILGMPRSGTTLVEQILASHSGVFGAGELNEMKFVVSHAAKISRFKQEYPNCVPGLTAEHAQQLGSAYLNRIQELAGRPDYARIIDKHPLNFQFIGIILSLFPRAKIIHTVRHPLDTCLSCFFQNFTKGQDYSFDIKTLGHFYNDYRRLMEHWETLYPGRIYTVKYEELLDNQEEETRKLLDYMGLDFEPACIEFHKTKRKVSTASFLQVRQPLYKTSRQRWRNYVHELRELAEIIGIRIDAPVTISGRMGL